MTRVLARLLTVVALIASALLLPTTSNAPTSTAQAADLAYFDPSNIIADAVFFDGLATDIGTVEAFLDVKGAKCVAGEMPCLKDYTQTTADQAGDAYCATYHGAPNETAAAILVKIGQACGINPRVLLVLLQKEQGLITGTRPTTLKYTKATGFGCPDTAACNPAFSGFVSQVYFAARQFERYAAGAAGSYRPGRNNTVYYHPDLARCGSSQVFIQNKATAGLYSYTPYQPNPAALGAGYGEGDSCSSYGNRNFWNYFTDWFGSTQSSGGGAIYLYAQGAAGRLGSPVTTFHCGLRDGGCYQQFQGGSVYWSPASGTHGVFGGMGIKWSGMSWENGLLGYPVREEVCGLPGGGCFQDFQGGSLYWGPSTGATFIRGDIRLAWGGTGWEGGWLGYPTTDEMCGLARGGCAQGFQNGSIYWSPATGAHPLNAQMQSGWAAQGRETGVLGYPSTDITCGLTGGGCLQWYEGGSLYWSPATGTHSLRGDIRGAWAAAGWEASWLGYPTTDEMCGLARGGCAQGFRNGSIYKSPATGVHAIDANMQTGWAAVGRETGVLGYPSTEMVCGLTAGGCVQWYEGGTQYWSPATGTHFLRGDIRASWAAAGWEGSYLGYPITNETCGLRSDGCFVHFQGGSVYWTARTGAHAVAGSIRDAWSAAGWENGAWGYPTSYAQLTGDRVTQPFQGGTATWNTTTGAVTFR